MQYLLWTMNSGQPFITSCPFLLLQHLYQLLSHRRSMVITLSLNPATRTRHGTVRCCTYSAAPENRIWSESDDLWWRIEWQCHTDLRRSQIPIPCERTQERTFCLFLCYFLLIYRPLSLLYESGIATLFSAVVVVILWIVKYFFLFLCTFEWHGCTV